MLNMHKNTLAGVNLVPSSGGAFEVTVNGKEYYSKLKTGQFPDEVELVTKLLTAK
jgi:selenoprotein W-related protein